MTERLRQARNKFPELDVNKDGSVDFDEYIKDSFSVEEMDDPEIQVPLRPIPVPAYRTGHVIAWSTL